MNADPASYVPQHPPYPKMTRGRIGGYTFGCGRQSDADVVQVALSNDYLLVTLGPFRQVCTDLDELVRELAIWMTECVCPPGLREAPRPTTLTTRTGYSHTRCNWDRAHIQRHREWLRGHLVVTGYTRGDLTWTPPPWQPLTREGHPGRPTELSLASQRLKALPQWSRTVHDNDAGGPWDRHNGDAIAIALAGAHTVVTNRRGRLVKLLRPEAHADQVPDYLAGDDVRHHTYERGDLVWTPRCGQQQPQPEQLPHPAKPMPHAQSPVAFPKVLVYPLQIRNPF